MKRCLQQQEKSSRKRARYAKKSLMEYAPFFHPDSINAVSCLLVDAGSCGQLSLTKDILDFAHNDETGNPYSVGQLMRTCTRLWVHDVARDSVGAVINRPIRRVIKISKISRTFCYLRGIPGLGEIKFRIGRCWIRYSIAGTTFDDPNCYEPPLRSFYLFPTALHPMNPCTYTIQVKSLSPEDVKLVEESNLDVNTEDVLFSTVNGMDTSSTYMCDQAGFPLNS